ncbi:hypothetical protein HY485_01635 [Candidatus Woesearchaeota archaeon]|nr:hypothetical protein [Candidatus Woesearchaeota archaeon]
MNAGKVLWGFVVLVVNIAVIFLMKNKLHNFGESIFLLLVLLFALIILKGWKRNAGWAWPSMIIFLSMALANNVYLFIVTKNILVFIVLIMLNVLTIILSMLWSLEKPLQKTVELPEQNNYEVFVPKNKITKTKRAKKK